MKAEKIDQIQRERVKTLLKEHGVSQADLADAIFLSHAGFSRVMTGKVGFHRDFASKIANYFTGLEREKGLNDHNYIQTEWIMGESDYRYVDDAFEVAERTMESERDLNIRIAIGGLRKCGYTVEHKSEVEQHQKTNKFVSTEDAYYITMPPTPFNEAGFNSVRVIVQECVLESIGEGMLASADTLFQTAFGLSSVYDKCREGVQLFKIDYSSDRAEEE